MVDKLVFKAPNQLIAPNQRSYTCTIGRAGVAAPGKKREGDLKTPSGSFPLRCCYYRPDRMESPQTNLPLIALTPEDGWCDDPEHPLYNQPVKLPFEGRHEKLWREDHVYDLIIPMGYNDGPITPGAGSAIFMHLMREDGVGTEGCIALKKADLLELLKSFSKETLVEVAGKPARLWSLAIDFLIGLWVIFEIFGTAFFSKSQAIFPQFAGPIGLAATAAFVFTLFQPNQWKILAGVVALPTVLVAIMLTSQLSLEGRYTLGWLTIAAVVLAASFCVAWLAKTLRKVLTK